jgi:hypothetical protein
MAGGIFGFGNPADPMTLLRMRALADVENPPLPPRRPADLPGPPQGPTPGGATLDTLPSSPSAPEAAPQAAPATPTPAPVAGPSGGGGNAKPFFGGIGTAISNALSGRGLFGGQADDDQIDPTTGAPRGLMRSSNMQSMMKMGIMLLAAGQRQSDESRARILSSMPSAIGDNTDQLNQFARTRLEMAKAKLLERQQLQEEAANAELTRQLGGGGAAPVSNAPAGTPALTPPALPTPAGAPPAAGSPSPATGQPLQLQPSPAASPVVSGPVPAPGPGGIINVGPRPNMAQPAAPAPASTPAPAPAQAAAQAPATYTHAGENGQTMALPTTRPPAPPFREWSIDQATPEQRSAILSVPDFKTRRELMQKYQEESRKQPYVGPQYYNPATNQIMQDTYQNGKLTGSNTVGTGKVRVVDRPGPDGTTIREKVDVAGAVVDRQEVRDPDASEVTTMTRKRVEDNRGETQKYYDETVVPSNQGYDRLGNLKDMVKDGRVIAGTGASLRVGFGNLMASMGVANPRLIDELVTTDLVGAELNRAAGEFAKSYYGPQISNQDVVNAKEAIGAMQSNSKERLEAVLGRMQEEAKKKIELYGDKYSRHEKMLGGSGLSKDAFGVPKFERDFRAEQEAKNAAAQASAATPATPAAPATPARPGATDPMEAIRAAARAELERRRGR